MQRVLLGLTALTAATLPPSPAVSQALSGNTAVHRLELRGAPSFRGDRRDFCLGARSRDGERRRSDRCRSDVLMDWYGGEWALYNNRSWAPDSYNDWWHDRPDRAYPAWMRRNHGCQRPWYSGDSLTC